MATIDQDLVIQISEQEYAVLWSDGSRAYLWRGNPLMSLTDYDPRKPIWLGYWDRHTGQTTIF